MSSAAQQRANQQNAQHSTGPRTAAGKQRSSRNALKHGFCAQHPLIPGEDPAAFERHFRDIELDLKPSSALEADLVEQIVDVTWRLKRLSRIEAAVVSEFYDDAAAHPLNQDGGEDLIGPALAHHNRLDALNRLSRYEAQLSRRYHRAVKEFRQFQKDHGRNLNLNSLVEFEEKQFQAEQLQAEQLRAKQAQPEPPSGSNGHADRAPDTGRRFESTEPTQSVATILESIVSMRSPDREPGPLAADVSGIHRIYPQSPGPHGRPEAQK